MANEKVQQKTSYVGDFRKCVIKHSLINFIKIVRFVVELGSNLPLNLGKYDLYSCEIARLAKLFIVQSSNGSFMKAQY